MFKLIVFIILSVFCTTPHASTQTHVHNGNIAIDTGQKIIVNNKYGGNNWIGSFLEQQPRFGIWTASVPRLVINYANGDVGIGTEATVNGYKLTVNGGIYALDLRIRPDLSNTADYVFEPDYPLMSLQDVKTIIQTKKHLPGVPSAKEMVENGVSIAEMNATLLQKIEELTLYVIQQDEKIANQEKQLNALRQYVTADQIISAR